MRQASNLSAPMRQALAVLQDGAKLRRLPSGRWTDGLNSHHAGAIAALIRRKLVRVTECKASRVVIQPSVVELATGASC